MEPTSWIIIGVLVGAGIFVMSESKINWNWVIGIVIVILLGASIFTKQISEYIDMTAVYTAVLASVALLQWGTYSLQAKIMNRQLYKDHYLEVYEKLSSVVGAILSDGGYSDKALADIWQARDMARLVLNDEIAALTEDLLLKIRRLKRLNMDLFHEELKLPIGEKRNAAADEEMRIVNEIVNLQLYEKFRGFIADK